MMKRWLVRLKRLRYSRGFGIQSPWAYRFVRYVINEHYPYYAYADLASSRQGDYRIPRLYFRIANYMQSGHWYVYHSWATDYEEYIRRGCVKCAVTPLAIERQLPERIDLASLSLTGDYEKVCGLLLSSAHAGTLLIVEGIRSSRSNLAYWRKIMADPRVRISFDLYDCGLLFFDPKQFKRHYIINF